MKNSRQSSTQRLALSALLTALMLVLGYVESLVPTGVPGIKLGLSNSVLLFAIYTLGIPAAFLLMAVKVLLSGFLFSGVNAMLYAFAGGLLSMLTMSILFALKDFHIVTIAMAGAVMHNVGQAALAMLMLGTDKLIYYMAVLMLVGLVTGFLTGNAAKILLRRIPKHLIPGSGAAEGSGDGRTSRPAGEKDGKEP